jgi:hypothetical protein
LVHCAVAAAKRWIGRMAYLEGFAGGIVVTRWMGMRGRLFNGQTRHDER